MKVLNMFFAPVFLQKCVLPQDEERLVRRHGLTVRTNNRWSLPSLPTKVTNIGRPELEGSQTASSC